MEVGIKNKLSVQVDEAKLADKCRSGTVPVFATPAMLALVEETAASSVADQLEEGETTVGISIDMDHLDATPMGMTVWAETELVEVDRKKLIFQFKVYDDKGLVGRGRHGRFIVNQDQFMAKANKKLGKD